MKCNSCGGRFGKMSRHQDGDEGKFNGIRVAWTSCSDNLSFEGVIGSNCKRSEITRFNCSKFFQLGTFSNPFLLPQRVQLSMLLLYLRSNRGKKL